MVSRLSTDLRAYITTFQDQLDSFFLVLEPLNYFYEYTFNEYFPEQLLKLKRCRRLRIELPDVIEGTYFTSLTQLEFLDSRAPLTDEMAPHLKSLTYLKIPSTTRCAPETFRFFSKLQQLEWYSSPPPFTPQLLVYLPRLRTLDCRGLYLTDPVLACLRNLEVLWLETESTVTDASLQHLVQLHTLAVTSDRITDASLRGMTQLRYVRAVDCPQLTFEGLRGKPLERLDTTIPMREQQIRSFGDTLTHWTARPNQVFNDRVIHSLPRLESLTIRNPMAQYTAKGFQALTQLKNLSVCRAPFFNDVCLEPLVGLEYLLIGEEIRKNVVTGSCFHHLTRLKKLSLGTSFQVLGTHLAALGNTLEVLDLGHVHSITAKDLLPLKKLRVLHLGSNTKVSKGDLSSLERMETIYPGTNATIPITVPGVEIKF